MSEISKREENNLIDPDEYLKKVEPKDDEDDFIPADELSKIVPTLLSSERLNGPFRHIEYKDADTIDVPNDKIDFRFAYSIPGEKLKSCVAKQYGDPDRWRMLDNIIFKSNGADVDLIGVLPTGYNVLFCPEHQRFHGAVSLNDKIIYIFGDIATPKSLLTLLHEMGHAFDEEESRKADRAKIDSSKINYRIAEEVRSERAATAFALRILRPFLKDQKFKIDAINFLKKIALQSYYDHALQNMERSSNADTKTREDDMDVGYMEGWDNEIPKERVPLYYDFYGWKTTDAYKQWKNNEDNKYLEDDKEVETWIDWIGKTGYDYKKDIKELGE
jgi:hypothetical protein